MANVKEEASGGGVEWRVSVDGSSSEILVNKGGFWVGLKGVWDIAVDDPRKVMYGLKVGIALSTLVSLFYYITPLYDGVGRGNAVWAVMTVVLVFNQYTVGGILYKCLNRICATALGGFVALGVYSMASHLGKKFEPIIMGTSVFILGSAMTFLRFIPYVKARYDYGCIIFILTFSLVSVSGYRVDKLLTLANQRLLTIVIGTCICILTSKLVFPVWAGVELHDLFPRNLDKLATSLESCVAEYFRDGEGGETSKKLKDDYKCVLKSEASEDSMANFARWEPAHGRFCFRHPWKRYLKVGATMRSVAYCLETLNSCLTPQTQATELIKNYLGSTCSRLSSKSCAVIRELAITLTTMSRSSKINIAVEEMKDAVKLLQNAVENLPVILEEKKDANLTTSILLPGLTEIFPVVSFASMLIEVAVRIEGLVEAVEELAKLAEFKPSAADQKPKQNQIMNDEAADHENADANMIALQMV